MNIELWDNYSGLRHVVFHVDNLVKKSNTSACIYVSCDSGRAVDSDTKTNFVF